jgi:hypothetical protein
MAGTQATDHSIYNVERFYLRQKRIHSFADMP